MMLDKYFNQPLARDSLLANMRVVAQAVGLDEEALEWDAVAVRLAALDITLNKQRNIESLYLALAAAIRSFDLLYASCSLFALFRLCREWSMLPGIESARRSLESLAAIDGVLETWGRFNCGSSLSWALYIRSLTTDPRIEHDLWLSVDTSVRSSHLAQCLGILCTPGAIDILKKMTTDHYSLDLRRAAERELIFSGQLLSPVALLSCSAHSSGRYSSMLALAILGVDEGVQWLSKTVESDSGRQCLELLCKGHPVLFHRIGAPLDIIQAIKVRILKGK